MDHVYRPQNIIIAGLTSAGKTTHARLLAQEYGLQYVSASTILLEMAGLSPEQALDFWVTPEGLQLSRSTSWKQIDDECRRLEANCSNTVFDTWSMAWLYSRKSMVIWIDSSLESRIMKAHISHKGQSQLSNQTVKENLQSKDHFARTSILENYGVDLFEDRNPFHLIVDISDFITAPTQAASEVSIRNADEIISSAVGWYIYRSVDCRNQLLACISKYGAKITPRFSFSMPAYQQMNPLSPA